MQFGFVPPPIPKDIWNAAAELLAPAIARGGENDLADVLADLDAGLAQLWVARDGKMLAACVTQGAGEALHFWLCGGGGCDWRDLADRIADAARGRFSRMTIDGRKGWARLLGFTRNESGLLERVI